MRDGSEGVLAKIIVGLIAIVFALFGFGSITTFLAPVPKVATVNGEEISQQEMEIAVERNRRMLMARDVPQDQINEDELRENVLDSLITREVLTQAAVDLDLHYGESALDAEIVVNEIFMIDGIFNPDQFQRVIGGAGYSPLSYRDEMRTDMLFDQLVSGIRDSAFVTEAEAKKYTNLFAQRRDIAYIRIAAAEVIDEIQLEDDEIESYYNANSSEFVTEEAVNVQYVELVHEDMAAAFEIDESELAEYFENTKSAFATDESRRVAHILVELSDDVSEEDAQTEALAIYERIIDGEDFSALAKETSDDLGSKDNGGDLGFNEQGTFYDEFEAVAYDLGLNQVAEPVLTEIGYHIIKVLDVREANVPDLADVRAEIEQGYRLEATEDDFVSASSRLAELLFENFSELETAAEELGLEIKSTGLVARDASNRLMSDASVSAAVFSPDVLLDGNNSDLIELSESHHVGLRVLEHQPSETKPLETVKEDIRYILQREKASELASTRALAIVEEVESGSLAQFVADQRNLSWQMVPGASRFQQAVDPSVLTEAFKLPRPAKDKESIGYSTLPNGDSLVVRVSAVADNPNEEVVSEELAAIQTNLARQLGTSDFQEFQQSLREEADLERVN